MEWNMETTGYFESRAVVDRHGIVVEPVWYHRNQITVSTSGKNIDTINLHYHSV